ncbi:MAG: hypothetical protein JWR19_3989 [Pedosphaera sp.]|nr:hypothetical protein [Pedosphaera sp.]
MKLSCFFHVPFWMAVCVMLTTGRVNAAPADALHMEVQLIWATNETSTKHKPIDADFAKRLGKTYRWKNYYEISQQAVSIPNGAVNTIKMSDQCKLDVKYLGGDRVEIVLTGEGKPVSKHVEKLALDWPLVLSGNAKNETAWLVVIKKVAADKAAKSEKAK